MRLLRSTEQFVKLPLLMLSLLLALKGVQPTTTKAQDPVSEGPNPLLSKVSPPCFSPDISPSNPLAPNRHNLPIQCDDILEPPLFASTNLGDMSIQGLNHTLAVYYVVPSDIVFDQRVFDRIKEATLEIQVWYQVATGGVTWELAFPEVVRVYKAKNPRQFYLNNEDWWGSLLPEMRSEGLSVWSPGTVTAVWAHGAGWWAGGAQGCGVDCGVALLGVEAFPEFNTPLFSGGECPDPDGQGVEAWPCVPLGAYIHELGHTLGLRHPIDDPATAPVASHSVMQTHWNYPDQAPAWEWPWAFLIKERQLMRQNPFMKTEVELIQMYQDAEVAVNLPVNGLTPTIDFKVEVTGNEVRFINNTQGVTLQYWTFGDYTVSNQVSPIHTYTQTGFYAVTLRASNDQSMMGVVHRTVLIPTRLFLPIVFK